jgi:hypothetical protein
MINEPEGSGESQEQAAGESLSDQARPNVLQTITQALRGDAEETPKTDDTEAGDAGESQSTDATGQGDRGESLPPPKTLSEAASLLKLDVTELYKLTIPDAHHEGESYTLGELKDNHEQVGEFTVKQLRWEEDRTKQQAELFAARQELEEVVTLLPKRVLESDALKAARQRLDTRASRERVKTLEVISEWRDEAVRTKDLTAMVEHMNGYGFPPEYLASVTDHKTLLYIRENMLRQQRVERALAMVEKTPHKQHGASRPTGKAPTKPGRQQTPGRGPARKRADLVDLLQPSE